MVTAALLALVLPLLQDPKDPKKDYCTEDEAKAHIAECKKEKGKTEDDTKAYLDKLGEKRHPRIFEEIKKYIGTGPVALQEEAAGEIAKYRRDAKASEALLNAARAIANKKDLYPLMQRYILSAGEVAYRPHASQFHALFKHRDADVVGEVVASCGKLKSKSSIEPLIKLLNDCESIKDPVAEAPAPPGGGGLGPGTPGGTQPTDHDTDMLKRKALVDPINRALSDITDEKLKDSKSWNTWWGKNRDFKEKAEE